MGKVADDININKYQLDEEWLTHAAKVLDYGELEAAAEEVLDRVELKRDITIAELDAEIRLSKAEDKITEAQVKNWIIRHERYKQVEEERIGAKRELKDLRAAVRSFEHRRYALSKLTELLLADHYSKNSYEAEAADKQLHKQLKAKRKTR